MSTSLVRVFHYVPNVLFGVVALAIIGAVLYHQIDWVGLQLHREAVAIHNVPVKDIHLREKSSAVSQRKFAMRMTIPLS